MNTKHYTTIEQSKKLLELGLNPESADMVAFPESEDNWEFTISMPFKEYKGKKKESIPCWSLGALLEVMPERISINDEPSYSLVLEKRCGSYNLTYGSYKRIVDNVTTVGLTPIEAAFSMVVWLLENGYIKKRE